MSLSLWINLMNSHKLIWVVGEERNPFGGQMTWCWNWQNTCFSKEISSETNNNANEKSLFGMCFRETEEVVMMRVERCEKNTLWPLILEHVWPDSIINTDRTRVYEDVQLNVELMDSILTSIKLFIKMVSVMSGMKVIINSDE